MKQFFNKLRRILYTPIYLLDRKKRVPGITLFDLYWIVRRPQKTGSSRFMGQEINYIHTEALLNNITEVFHKESYRFETPNPAPRILDCGAYIGLSVIYFKQLYPEAVMTAFEADPLVFETLKKNMAVRRFSNVELINKAIWDEDTELEFFSDQTMSGSLFANAQHEVQKIKVKTTRLRPYLTQKIDLLKIDIEGAEYQVIKDIADCLNNVDRIFMEYHSLANEEQKLDEILLIFKEAGFRYYIQEANPYAKWPFVDVHKEGFDLQLDIFCTRL